MRTARRLLTTALCLAAAGLSLPAAADTVTLFTTSHGHQNIDTSLTGVEGVGQFVAEWNGRSFLTYCTDVYEPFAFNTPYTNYVLAPTGSAHGFTARQADLLGKLYTVADNGVTASVDSKDKSVAFQLAVWELVNEPGNTFSVSAGADQGVFYVESGATDAQVAMANSWLSQAAAASTSGFAVTRLASDGQQDMLTVAAVPEPSTYAMLALGLAAVAGVARRRQR